MDREGLLDLAIRHELGHALRNEPDERNAEGVAKLLEQRKPVSCEVKAEAKQKRPSSCIIELGSIHPMDFA